MMTGLPMGARVVALIGEPIRHGTVVRRWTPFAQYRVRWDDGTETNIDHQHLRLEETP